MIFIVCQRVILIYFSAKSEMVARLRGHDRFFCHVRRSNPLILGHAKNQSKTLVFGVNYQNFSSDCLVLLE